MKLYSTILFSCIISFSYGQTDNAVFALKDRTTKNPASYFDINDPKFLIPFVNNQKFRNKLKLFKFYITNSKGYSVINSAELNDYIDSVKRLVYRDTGHFCVTGEVSIKKKNHYIPISHYIFWINNRYWYRIGDDGKKTIEFIDEFLLPEKIKSIEVVVPTKINSSSCLDKTLAYFYITLNRRTKNNYKVANLKFRQAKLGNRWIGHN